MLICLCSVKMLDIVVWDGIVGCVVYDNDNCKFTPGGKSAGLTQSVE